MSSALATPLKSIELDLPESGWSLLLGRGSHWRPALEVHTDDGLIDIAVAGGLDSSLLRGAIRGRRGRRGWAVAWGHLPAGAESVGVEFRTRRSVVPVTATVVAGAFWVAEAPGSFRSVAVTGDSGSGTAARLRRYR